MEVSRLRLAMLSGDWMPVTLPDAVRRRVPGLNVSLGGAVIALPDPLMGERTCACVVPRGGTHPPTLRDVQAAFRGRGRRLRGARSAGGPGTAADDRRRQGRQAALRASVEA
ncbi:hypothetical protein Slala03_69800 [Streptomyces lavendulae subsp. lavendulae]|nr:hypothetical protein Slala03_69800 [Streptomyces lavendulae subsp. lavendulae]